ncbi:MAG TPA: ATP-binding protein [Limnochordia bacterium]|nr:ATP-binding protein [Limnochordia bacterium]
MSISEALFALLLAGLQIYVSLRLIGRETTWWKVISFALLHASSVILFSHILPSTSFRFLAITASYFVYWTWIFNAPVFPDALACYLTVQALQAMGDLAFRLLARSLPIGSQLHTVLLKTGPHVPLVGMMIYFLAIDLRNRDRDKREPSARPNSVDWLIACGILAIGRYLMSPVTDSLFCDIFVGGCLVAMPLSCYAIKQCRTKDHKTERSLQYHVRQHVVQKSAINTLREERHDFVNELTLISTYLQMGKLAEAVTCIDYSSAKLADRNNYAALPHDAWITILESKQKEAQHRQFDFRVNIQAEAPWCFKEQRLLPRLVINLVDNAFEAVAKQPDPQVSLSWSFAATGERLLTVSNNGPEISPRDGEMIFQGGITTKTKKLGNHGWGLVICKDIASELQGSLSYQSSPEHTTFTLTLPPNKEEVGETYSQLGVSS